MTESVELYGVKLEDVPLVGGFISDRKNIRRFADALAVGRVVGGSAVAGYIMTHAPEQRSWLAAGITGTIGTTDRLDGDLIRALKDTLTAEELAIYEQSKEAKRGALLDQLADKAFVLQPMAALAMRGEISWSHVSTKVGRDVAVTGTKFAKEKLTGNHPSAIPLARVKAGAEMGAVTIGASPLSALYGPDGETRLTEYAFRAASSLSVVTGGQYVADLTTAVLEMKSDELREIILEQTHTSSS